MLLMPIILDDTDCDNNNVILSRNNRCNHNAINDENNVSKPTRHVNSDNAIILSNDCDKNNGVKTVNLNVTFSSDNGNSCETVDDIDINNFTNINNDSNKMIYDNGNANNSETGIVLNNVMIFPFYDDGNISGILDMNNDTNDRISYNENNNGVTFSCNDDNIMNNILQTL